MSGVFLCFAIRQCLRETIAKTDKEKTADEVAQNNDFPNRFDA